MYSIVCTARLTTINLFPSCYFTNHAPTSEQTKTCGKTLIFLMLINEQVHAFLLEESSESSSFPLKKLSINECESLCSKAIQCPFMKYLWLPRSTLISHTHNFFQFLYFQLAKLSSSELKMMDTNYWVAHETNNANQTSSPTTYYMTNIRQARHTFIKRIKVVLFLKI